MNEYSLDDLKQAFQSIPVPEELAFRVSSAIALGERDAKRKQRGKNIVRFWKTAGTTVAAAAAAVVILANTSPGIACAMEQIPVLGAITRVVTFRTFEDEQGTTSAHIDVPRVEGGGTQLNDAIESYTNTIIAEYQRDSALTQAYGGDETAPHSESNHYSLDLTYTVVTDNDAVFALRFDKDLVMASGVESVKIYNVDKATGKILSLDDLFRPGSDYLDALTRNIQEQMQSRMDADEDQCYWLHEEAEGMNFTRLSADAAFYIDGDGQLVIVFDEGDVAPMYMGVVEFTIPPEAVEGLTLPGYLA